MEYKDTLLMPKTAFQMKANLPNKDKLYFEKQKIKNTYLDYQGEEFILHDGPPYANGNLHIGHALNKILKDFIVRSKVLSGNKVDWTLGWDTHGLPIEIMIQKKGIKYTEVGVDKYLEECENYALKQVENQLEQFKNFALFTDFSKKYVTLTNDYVEKEINVFYTMLNKKLVYRDFKPVYWSWSSVTALADAEIEYKDIESYSIFVPFKLNDDLSFLIWTTTPWTLTSNVAIAYGKDIQYVVVMIENNKYVVAKNLVDKISKKLNKDITIVGDINLFEYESKSLINPLNGNNSIIVEGHHVTTEDGTGLVHISGGHGLDDYLICRKYNLEVKVSLNERGIMINSGQFNDQFYLKAEPLIIEYLESINGILYWEKFTHSHPIDWRTKKPVIYRATRQWFVNLNNVKEDLIENLKDVNWKPDWASNRLKSMIETRNEWCISRQRIWGVPIAVIYDENDEIIIDKELQSNTMNLFLEKGILGWHKVDIKDLLPPHIKYNEKMRKEQDILDVWFDSGSSSQYYLQGKKADIYIEGNDQFRGWFNSSLITSTITDNQAPYKKVITHGMVNDGEGKKMSKSIGNVVDPIKIINKYGVDILRLWVASMNYLDNVKISDSIIQQISLNYRKIRNTLKFLIANTADFDKKEVIPLSGIHEIVMNKFSQFYNKAISFYNNQDFSQVIKSLMNELNSSGSLNYYLDYSKDILYIHNKNSNERIMVQYVLHKILINIFQLLEPIIPVTIDEACNFTNLVGNIMDYKFKQYDIDDHLIELWDKFTKIRSIINVEVEKGRTKGFIKRSQEASVELTLTKEYDFVDHFYNINRLMLVGEINIKYGEELSCLVYEFKNSRKCPRCWNLFKEEEFDGEICHSCSTILKEKK